MAQKNTSTGDAKNSESTAVANPATSNSALPAYLQNRASGKENIDQSDMLVPRVALMQSTHPEVEEQKVQAGNFWHTVLEESLGSEVDDLIVVHHSKRYTLWKPRHEGGGILARASDGRYWDPQYRGMKFEVGPDKNRPRHKVTWEISKDGKVDKDTGLGAWGSSDPTNEDSQPAATLTHVLVCVRASNLDMGPFVILLQRTSEKVAKGLLTKVNLDPAPIYAQVYRMGVKTDSGPSGDYKQYTFAKNGYAPEELIDKLEELNKQFTTAGVKYDESKGEPESDDAGAAGGGDDSNARY